jgi:hypothetical protein
VVAVILGGSLLGFNPPPPDGVCGLYVFADFATFIVKVAIAGLLGSIAGSSGSVGVGMLLGGLIGVAFGPFVYIPIEGAWAQRAFGVVLGGLVGVLGAIAGRTTPIEDRIACGYGNRGDSHRDGESAESVVQQTTNNGQPQGPPSADQPN